MQKPHEEKASKLTLRDLVVTCYLQEVSRGHSKLRNEPRQNGGGLTTDEGLKVRIGRRDQRTYRSEKKTRKPKHIRELLTGG